MDKPKPDADALAKSLQASLAQRRPQTWKPVLTAIVISSLLLAGMWYWLKPRPRTAPLQIIAIEELFTPEESPTARAQLYGGESSVKGQTIAFFEQMVAEPREILGKSDAKGSASVAWPMPGVPAAAYFVQHRNDTHHHQSNAVRGLLFVWPKNAPLLIVDADDTLIGPEADEKAEETLRKADEEGWRIVYLAVAGPTPADYVRTIGWFEDRVKIPRGPVLGRETFGIEQPVEAARHQRLTSLKARFNGPMLYLVGSADAVQTGKALELPTLQIGDGHLPWADVPVRLK